MIQKSNNYIFVSFKFQFLYLFNLFLVKNIFIKNNCEKNKLNIVFFEVKQKYTAKANVNMFNKELIIINLMLFVLTFTLKLNK